MKSIFSKLKNATKSLFSSNKEETKQEVDQQVSTIEEQLNAFNDQNLKAKIINSREFFCQLIVHLTWPKILELKISYALERRKNFQPRLVLQEQTHCEKIIIQYCQEVLCHFSLQGLVYYNESEVIKMVNIKVLQEQCQKILFSKEELRDYFEFYRDAQEYLREIRKLDYSVQAMRLIEKQYLIDLGFEKFNIDECDERKAISLFRDDEEVKRWYKEKCQYVQE